MTPERPPQTRVTEILSQQRETAARIREYSARRDFLQLCAEVEYAKSFLAMMGYRRCDIPACNCGLWHGGNAELRLREIAEALEEAGLYPRGNTVLDALRQGLAERTEFQQALEWIASQRELFFAECSLAEEIVARAVAALTASPAEHRARIKAEAATLGKEQA